ncbi:MAG: HD-like signal output (HDOD) protein [Lentimonas sp.]|jgi:HD-like signal output (HDOD) protein
MPIIKLEKIVSELVDIPPAVQIFPKLLQTLRAPESDIEDITQLIKVDVSLSSQVLRFAGTSFYGSGSPVNGLVDAIQRIGFRETNRLVTLAAFKNILSKPLSAYNEKEGELMQNALATAQVMHAIGQAVDRDSADLFYTTGLFHGIGKIAINQYLKNRGLSLYGGDGGSGDSTQVVSIELERKTLGFDHAEVGAALLENWSFASNMTQAIRYQYIPHQNMDQPRLTHALNFASKVGEGFIHAGKARPNFQVSSDHLIDIQLTEEQMQNCMDVAFDEFVKIKEMIHN